MTWAIPADVVQTRVESWRRSDPGFWRALAGKNSFAIIRNYSRRPIFEPFATRLNATIYESTRTNGSLMGRPRSGAPTVLNENTTIAVSHRVYRVSNALLQGKTLARHFFSGLLAGRLGAAVDDPTLYIKSDQTASGRILARVLKRVWSRLNPTHRIGLEFGLPLPPTNPDERGFQ